MMSLKQKLTQIPKASGVYFFRDTEGAIIYIGKAKNLRKRVKTYFSISKTKSRKLESHVWENVENQIAIESVNKSSKSNQKKIVKLD